MKRILLISDNHSYNGKDIIQHLDDVDEIWHAGDIGSLDSIRHLRDLKTFRGVYGNIDNHEIRAEFPLNLHFECEGVSVFMTHIGGYPGRYNPRVKKILMETSPKLYVCGHSHICKVMYDKKLKVLHMNPGAYGFHGWHKVRTILKFSCENGKIIDAQVIELGYRGQSILPSEEE